MDTQELGFIVSPSMVQVFTNLYKESRENPNGKAEKDRHNNIINNER